MNHDRRSRPSHPRECEFLSEPRFSEHALGWIHSTMLKRLPAGASSEFALGWNDGSFDVCEPLLDAANEYAEGMA